jgi:outer membrane receptor for ferrienterochelin and colicins
MRQTPSDMTHRIPSPRRPGACHGWVSGLLVLPLLVAAQSPQPAQATDAAPAPAQRIEITSGAGAQRRADPAGRLVVGREELLRHGDSQLVDALQRLPGVSTEGRGSGTALKLGGMGGGYTQLLLNGEPLPQGLSLDSIALDSIERVEITRGSSVQSSQAIAGSINLVTRRPATRVARDIKLQAASLWGRPRLSATLNLGDAVDGTTWGLGLVASSERQLWPATVLQERREGADDTVTQRVRTDKHEFDRTDALSVNPRLAFKRDAGDGAQWQLSTDHSLRYAVSRGGVHDERLPLLGSPPAQQTGDLALNYDRLFWRGRLQAQRRTADGAQVEARLNVTHSSRDQQARALGYSFAPALVQDSAVDGRAVDQSAVLNLNHQRPLGTAHRLDLGTEWERARRREDRVQTERDLPGGLPPNNLDERFDARVQRWALYLQDDWTLAEGTAAQLGVRVERLDTLSEGNDFVSVRQSHRLVGPVMRVSTRPFGGPGTFKLGLSRGFKLPAPRDVMPRRYVPIEVSPTAPAWVGNPDLRPERAWSLDGSWLAPLPACGGELVISASLRRIEDVILDRLISQPEDRAVPWLLQRVNAGSAWSAGLEVEMRGQLTHTLAQGAPLRWQASLALARSRLDAVDAERPALPGQAPWQLKLNLTQPLAPGWTAQLDLDVSGAAVADQPSGRRIETRARRSMGLGLQWQPKPRVTWRLSAARIGATDDGDNRSVRVVEPGGPVTYWASEAWHREVEWRLSLDSPF